MLPTELRGRRERLGLSQADLGRGLGIARNTVARWERGQLEIRHPELVSLALDRLGQHATDYPNGTPSRDSPRTNLPAEPTSFIGRQEEIGAVCRQLSSSRFVTLAGTGAR